MLFRDMEFDFDIYDAEAAEDYEREAKALQAHSSDGIRKGESLSDYIKRQCEAIFAFFDNLLGEGTHRELFGDRVNLRVALETLQEFRDIVEGQMKALPGHAKTEPNRETRRAGSRRKPPAEA